jgi:acyl-CoA thioesterase FadM
MGCGRAGQTALEDSRPPERCASLRGGLAEFSFLAGARDQRYRAMLTWETTVSVRFEDADPAGVVFYPRAIALAHGVVEDMIRQSALGWAGWFASAAQAAPLRRAEAEFSQPMRPGESFTARAVVEKLGETSVTFGVGFYASDGARAAQVTTVHVLISKATGRPAPLTAEIRAAFG